MTKTSIKLAAAAAIALGSAGLLAGPASAAPMLDPGVAHSDLTGANPEAVRWVCGPYRCWWRPGPYYYGGGYGFYGRPRYGYGWGRPGWGGGGWGYRRGWGGGGWRHW